jgi:hypothetical protein
MQISAHEVEKLVQRFAPRAGAPAATAGSVAELARKYDVDPQEAEQVVESLQLADPDPWRERRLRELAARIEAGTYRVEAAEIIDMAERRALADRAGEL